METSEALLKRFVETRDWDWRNDMDREEALMKELVHIVPIILEKLIKIEKFFPDQQS